MKNQDLLSALLVGTLVLVGCSINGDPLLTAPASESDTDSSGATPVTSSGTEAASEATSGTGESPTSTDGATSTGGDGEILNCDPWEQDCPDGYKCMAYTDEGNFFTGTKCTPLSPNPKQSGDTCYGEGGWSTGVDDCDIGLACWNINPETFIGGCVPLCTGTMDNYSCPEPDEICVFWVPGLAHVCLEECSPLIQDCPVGQLCGPNWATAGQDFVCYIDWSFEEGQTFDACYSANTCDPGHLCSDPAEAIECPQDAGCCLPYCDLNAPECTGEGAVCEPFYEEGTAPPEHANLGVCGLPG